MSQVHYLKTWTEYFDALNEGKTFEIRKNDRGFEVGDVLVLEDYDDETKTKSGRFLTREVSYMIQGCFGLPQDVCVMGIVASQKSREIAVALRDYRKISEPQR